MVNENNEKRLHVNSKGKLAECTATIRKCKYGDNHYSSEADYYESRGRDLMESKAISKKTNGYHSLFYSGKQTQEDNENFINHYKNGIIEFEVNGSNYEADFKYSAQKDLEATAQLMLNEKNIDKISTENLKKLAKITDPLQGEIFHKTLDELKNRDKFIKYFGALAIKADGEVKAALGGGSKLYPTLNDSNRRNLQTAVTINNLMGP